MEVRGKMEGIGERERGRLRTRGKGKIVDKGEDGGRGGRKEKNKGEEECV